MTVLWFLAGRFLNVPEIKALGAGTVSIKVSQGRRQERGLVFKPFLRGESVHKPG